MSDITQLAADRNVIDKAATFVHAIGGEKVWISLTGEVLLADLVKAVRRRDAILDEQQEAQS